MKKIPDPSEAMIEAGWNALQSEEVAREQVHPCVAVWRAMEAARIPTPPSEDVVQALARFVAARDAYLEADIGSDAERAASNTLDEAHELARLALVALKETTKDRDPPRELADVTSYGVDFQPTKDRETASPASEDVVGLLKQWRSLVQEGGVPRYTVLPGAALNTLVTWTDAALNSTQQPTRETDREALLHICDEFALPPEIRMRLKRIAEEMRG